MDTSGSVEKDAARSIAAIIQGSTRRGGKQNVVNKKTVRVHVACQTHRRVPAALTSPSNRLNVILVFRMRDVLQ
jgi:hypothetical protein